MLTERKLSSHMASSGLRLSRVDLSKISIGPIQILLPEPVEFLVYKHLRVQPHRGAFKGQLV